MAAAQQAAICDSAIKALEAQLRADSAGEGVPLTVTKKANRCVPTKDLFNLVKAVGKIVERTIIVCQGCRTRGESAGEGGGQCALGSTRVILG